MPFTDLPDVRLFHIDRRPSAGVPRTGALGIPTVLIHGMWGSVDTWTHQLPRLRTRCRTHAVDLRGHGRTGPAVGGYSTDRHAADVEAFVERLALGPVVLIGHSMGASVAAVLAARRPDLVHAQVSIDPDYAGTDDSRARLRALADELDGPSAGAAASRIVSALAQGPDTPAHLVEQHRLAAMRLPPETRARIFRHNAFHPGSIRFRPEADALLRRRPQPVLALHRDTARMRADEQSFTHPDSKAVAVRGAGHFFHQEIPAYVNSEIDRWLATLPPPASRT
ncbi:alpha/beta fold hydrolase [Streptomyces sp. NPDC048438]|uniref:alpha/beta fold hydrolase n=1 Tax=Streptomyces sp. NPDC048438 TaxID=3365551 RepID=UPI00371B2B51